MQILSAIRKHWYLTVIPVVILQTVSAQETQESDEDIYELSPFVVDTTDNVGYLATSTLAGTRLNTELKDVGSAISVVTQEFLQDTGATNNETLLVYTLGTEVAGIDGNFTNVPSSGSFSYQGADTFLTPHTNTRVRGLTAADNTRDFFVTDIPWDSFNVDRVDLQRGPNSILFGLGSPAGIINTAVRTADFTETNGEVSARFGRYGSYRGTLDYNRVVLDNELAVRVSALMSETKYQQKPAFAEDERLYFAAKYEPKFLRTDSARTTIRINAEVGDITSNRPRTVTPGDNITPWFTHMNKLTIDPYDNMDRDSKRPNTAWEHNTFADGTANPDFDPWIGNWGQLFGGVLAIWDDASSSTMARYFAEPERTNAHTPHKDENGNDLNVAGVSPSQFRAIRAYHEAAQRRGLPNADDGVYKNQHLLDSSIFDFYNNLIDGDNKREFQEWDTFNLTISQGFFNEKVGLEFVYDDQNYTNEILRLLANERQNIYIDIHHNLPDGSPNPNVGRPFVTDAGRYGNGYAESQRESFRFTGYVDLDIGDLIKKENLLTRILGRHVISGVYSEQERRQYREEFQRYATDADFGNLIGFDSYEENDRQINTVHYLGESLINRNSAVGANIPRITATQKPQDGQVYIFDTHWNATGVDFNAPWTNPRTGLSTIGSRDLVQGDNPANYVGWTNVPFRVLDATDPDDRPYTLTNATRIRDIVESKVLVWQGYFWDGALVGTVGYREDTARNWSINAPKNADRTVNMDDFKIRGEEHAKQTGDTTSYSIVAHLDQLLPEGWLPFNLSVFYNDAENFQPAAGRVDILNRPLPAPSGTTEDYGFMISTKDNRYAARVNWYETKVAFDSNSAIANIHWAIGIPENWAHSYAVRYRDGLLEWSPKDGMSPEETAALQAASLEAWFANPPTDIIAAWGGDLSDESLRVNHQTTNPPSGMTATGDTVSKGLEIELIANPLENLRLSLNVAKTEAMQANVGGSFVDYVEERLDYYRTTPAGEMRIWWGGGDSILQDWTNRFLGQYEIMKILEGTATPELRKWRANFVANYSFIDGVLKGANVGGGIRWQDKVAIGYPIIPRPEGGVDYDVGNPYTGGERTEFDFWAGYERPINDKIHWRIQLNIRNAFGKNELIPISTQPDGSTAAARIAPNMGWEITNTFRF
ncbi:MAG: TonB-dependent receptor plug domain-containing protein [Puniceicoccaceae bacterium]